MLRAENHSSEVEHHGSLCPQLKVEVLPVRQQVHVSLFKGNAAAAIKRVIDRLKRFFL